MGGINFSDHIVPLYLPGILFLISGILMIRARHHSYYIKFIHALGRFYISFCYLVAQFNVFGLHIEDYQALFRAAISLLAFEEIMVWVIEHKWPTRKM